MKFKRFANQIYPCFRVEKMIRGSIVAKPYKSNDKWYMSIFLNELSCSLITDYELSFEMDEKEKIQQTIRNGVIVVKLPYRYNRFECRVYDKDGDPLTCYDLKDDDRVKVKLEHACFSYQDENILSTWKVKEIIVNENIGTSPE